MDTEVSEELGEIIVDKETARASYVTLRSLCLLTYLFTYLCEQRPMWTGRLAVTRWCTL